MGLVSVMRKRVDSWSVSFKMPPLMPLLPPPPPPSASHANVAKGGRCTTGDFYVIIVVGIVIRSRCKGTIVDALFIMVTATTMLFAFKINTGFV
jgi:hypothetical protein